jgi:histidyl-tRNA synthetase
MIMMAGEALEAIGAKRGEYCIKINTRRLLNGLLDRVADISKTDVEAAKLTVLRAIDKLDRLGPQGVAHLLGAGRKDESGDFTPGANLPSEAIDLVLGFVQAGKADRSATLSALEVIVGQSEEGRAGLAELQIIEKILDANGVDVSRAAFDPSIVRGLEYYTGPVFEAHLDLKDANGKAISFGSVGGGGRYDDLVSRFRGESVPATGFSIGVSRLLSALEAAGRPLVEPGGAPVIVIAFDKNDMGEYFALAGRLRGAGVGAEVYLGEGGMKAQMRYADRRGAPLAIFFGENEKNAGRVTIKDLRVGKKAAEGIKDNEAWRAERPGQVECALADLAETAKRMLSEG